MRPFHRDLFLSALAGWGVWASFPSLSWWWALIPSLALFFSRVDGPSTSRSLLNTLVFASCWWLPLVHWVTLATGGWLPWVALAATQILQILVWTLIARLCRVWAWARTLPGQSFAYALTWVGVEQFRSHYPWSGFPWGNIAMPQVDSPLGHLAPWGGEVLVSASVVVLAVLLRRVFSLRSGSDAEHWYTRPLALLAGVGVLCASAFLPLHTAQEAGAVKLGVVQGDVELPGNQTFAIEGKVASNNAAQTLSLAENGGEVDLVIWGETGADRDPRASTRVAQILEESATRAQAPLLFGFANTIEGMRWNWLGVWMVGEGLDSSTLYAKQKPVPFGEFIPYRSLISKLATEAAQVSVDMAAGSEPGVMRVRLRDGRSIPLAVGICFEAGYSSVFSEGVNLGGQILIEPSNNYHFRSSAESLQQAQLMRFRAMEFSRSAVQASTTGVSMVIRPDGAIQAQTEPQSASWLKESVPLRTSITVAAHMGELPAQIVMVLTGVFLLVSLGRWSAVRQGRRKAHTLGRRGAPQELRRPRKSAESA